MTYKCPDCNWTQPQSSFHADSFDIILHERTHRVDDTTQWCCGCGERGVGMKYAFVKHIQDNPDVNHKERCEELHD